MARDRRSSANAKCIGLLKAVEDRPRDHALIRLLNNGGLRVSERNLVEGVTNVTGKAARRGSCGTWAKLQALRTDGERKLDEAFGCRGLAGTRSANARDLFVERSGQHPPRSGERGEYPRLKPGGASLPYF
jgi:hypothetical protein